MPTKKIVKNQLTTKRFVIRKSLIGTNTVITFTNKKGDECKYDHDLVYTQLKDKFERKFDESIALDNPSDDESRALFGRKLCLWAAQEQVQFRNVVETWITAGSFHGLADRSEIGWHPHFVEMFDAKKGEEDA